MFDNVINLWKTINKDPETHIMYNNIISSLYVFRTGEKDLPRIPKEKCHSSKKLATSPFDSSIVTSTVWPQNELIGIGH